MDPRVTPDSYVRIKNKSGMTCPLYRQPTSEVCHTCELWQPLEVEIDGKSQTLWKCALVWCGSVQVITSHHLSGIQKAAELTRNEVAHAAKMQTATVAGLVALFEQQDGRALPPPARASRLIANGEEGAPNDA